MITNPTHEPSSSAEFKQNIFSNQRFAMTTDQAWGGVEIDLWRIKNDLKTL